MNTTQLQILKAAILADSNLTDLVAQFATVAIKNYLQGDSTFIVWKTMVTRREILQNGFDWTRLDNLSVGPARIWSDIFVDGYLNPSKPNVRAGIEAVWRGAAPDLAVRAAIYVHCKRPASIAEKLFATGVGTHAEPGLLTLEGIPTEYDVVQALSQV